MELTTIIGISILSVFIVMSITWALQYSLKNAGIVDVAWSYNFPLLAIIYLISTDGYINRKLLIASMVVVWGFRLGTYLLIRTASHITEEDGRYKQLRTEWKEKLQLKFFLFFQFQGVLNLLLSFPFLIISLNTDSEIKPIEVIGVVIWLIAIIGEALADYQLKKFKSKAENKGKVCQSGLWYYSRHPNYFFELLIWVAYFIMALGSPLGWISIFCPLMIGYFLFRVTGIPMTEEQAIRSKGEAYIDYQKTTSAFIPWFKK
jgi:steroid 5-alpha reductase family enzyme